MNDTAIVHVVDDDDSFRAAVSRLLRASGFNVRAFTSGAELLTQISAGARGCVLADLRMPEVDGLQLQQMLSESRVAMPIVFLTGQGDIPSTVRAMRNGAVDFLEKSAPRQQLIAAVTHALESDEARRAARARREELGKRFAALTAREREVLAHVVRGQMNKEIAADLGIHERTVKLHRTAITRKAGVTSVAELTTLAREACLF